MDNKILERMGRTKIIIISAVLFILLSGGLFFLLRGEEEDEGVRYDPTEELPQDYGIIMEAPFDNDTMMFTAMLSSLAVEEDGTYHPMFILEEDGGLDAHQMDTIEKADLLNRGYLLFMNDPEANLKVEGQVDIFGKYDMGPGSLGRFMGFNGIISVSTFEEALWASSIAKKTGKVMVKGPETYSGQEEAWMDLQALGVPFEYVIVINPLDLSAETLHYCDGYDTFDDQFHVPALSAIGGELAAYRDAYVLTQYTASHDEIGYMDTELNQRAIGYYQELKKVTGMYGLPKNIALVGSASAVPQFQLPDETNEDPENVEGDLLVSSDVVYGFMGEDPYYMDCAVGRLVNLNLQGMTNLIVRTFMYDRFEQTVTIDYTAGTENVDWRQHGTSFSGYDITYKRGQVTPARFWCRDAADEGMTYDYIGPSGFGRDILIGDGVEPRAPEDMNKAMEASGFIAYRGHGSEYGSLYMVPYAINRNENGVLRGEEVAQLLLPPQVGFWVACMNSKIHGAGWWKPAEPIEVERTFALNYLYGGAVIAGGATEVSFSNIAQDTTSATEEWLPGIINNNWDDNNYEWDLNDAWFAFFWDAILDKEGEYGTAGEALRWAENRYIHNPIRGRPVSPLIQDQDDPDWQGGLLGAHWKEVAMFVVYGDPAFSPAPNRPGENSYRPWTNGVDDTGEP